MGARWSFPIECCGTQGTGDVRRMRPQELRDHLRRQPFQPIRLTLTDGRTYEVRHPELAMVGRSMVAISLARRGDPDPDSDRLVTIPLVDVLRVEPSESSPAGST